jgi:hypothetical protein
MIFGIKLLKENVFTQQNETAAEWWEVHDEEPSSNIVFTSQKKCYKA